MKKTSIIAAFVVVVLSATALMAQQLDDYSEELKVLIQSDVGVQYNQLDQQHQAIKNAIKVDIESVRKYQTLEADYNVFLDLMENKSLKDKPAEAVGQTIFIVIDNLAKDILALPAHAQETYVKALTTSKYFFNYNGKVVDLKDLFELATSLKDVYTNNETAIVKILNKTQNTAKETHSTFWQEFLQGFVRGAQMDK